MPTFSPQPHLTESSSLHSEVPPVLGTSLDLILQEFPELDWLADYLATLNALEAERTRLTQEIEAIAQEGDIYRNQWIEPYSKTKNGKTYSYFQLRWLTGERKKSGQPKVKTKHLPHRQVAEIQRAIARGKQVEALEQQRQAVEQDISRLKQLFRKRGGQLMGMKPFTGGATPQ